MRDHLIGHRQQMQRLPAVSQLPTRLLATAPPLTARALASQRIARGRFAAVVAVLGEAGPQLLVLRQHLLHLRPERDYLGDLRLERGYLGFQCGDAFFCCLHGTMLHLYPPPAKIVPSWSSALGAPRTRWRVARRHIVWLLARGPRRIAGVPQRFRVARWARLRPSGLGPDRVVGRVDGQLQRHEPRARHRCLGGGAGPIKRIVVVRDRAGDPTSPLLQVPDGLHLVFLPPSSPELQPAAHLWHHTDQPRVNQHVVTIDDLEDAVAAHCDRLHHHSDVIRSAASFHWWAAA
jgi:hypothetical protein